MTFEDKPALIALDWGTTSLRAYLVGAEGAVLERRQSAEGIRNVRGGAFAETFSRAVQGWPAGLPAIACGMIGSRNGWHEAPYCDAPADAPALAAALARVPGSTVAIVPGVRCIDRHGDPDVMRGEETQLIGASLGGRADGLFLLPGTHNKWAQLEAGRIVRFSTWMTGELHAALLAHTILGAFGQATGPSPVAEQPGPVFSRGVDRALAEADFLHALFTARSRVLEADLQPADVPDYVSGLLIGEEIRGARAAGWLGSAAQVTLIGDARLTARYARALEQAAVPSEDGPPDVVVPGLHAIARAAGFLH